MNKRIVALITIVLGLNVTTVPVLAISETQEVAIRERCDAIKDDLKVLQRSDSRARVYLGRYYETILSKFVTSLNVRLVENNLSNTSFINNQNDFSKTKTNFTIDYIEYQKELEKLTGIDCRSVPGEFYNQLVVVREKRAVVADDVIKLRNLAIKHVDLVTTLKEGL